MPHVEVPQWAGSKGGAVYSVDITDEYFACACDGKVLIWDLSAVAFQTTGHVMDWKSSVYKSDENTVLSNGVGDDGKDLDGALDPDPKVSLMMDKLGGKHALTIPKQKEERDPRLIASLGSHEGSVLAVKFSNDSKYLASAGDDASVCIYTQVTASSGVSAFDDNNGWMRTKLCKGHNLDVVGVDFSQDDRILCSCSLDKDASIILWDFKVATGMIVVPLKILQGGHASLVKGIAFDPLNSYLATSGDDCKVCIWNLNGDLEGTIDFTADTNNGIGVVPTASSQSLFRRISWSPDGTYLCCTNVTIKNKQIAAMVKRNKWTSEDTINLVGHKQSVCASDFCNDFLEGGNKLLILGDKRGFLTVWTTKLSKPLFKVRVSDTSITDVRFSSGEKAQTKAVVSALDGSVTLINFSEEEIGPKVSRKQYFQEKYGVEDIANSSGTSTNLIEDSISMLAQDSSVVATNGSTHRLTSKEESAPKINVLTPKVRSKSGKKRIMPQLVTIAPAKADSNEATNLSTGLSATNDPIKQAKEATDSLTKRIKFAENHQGEAKMNSDISMLQHTPLHIQQSKEVDPSINRANLLIVPPQISSSISIDLSAGINCNVVNELKSAQITISKEGVILWRETLNSAQVTSASSSTNFLALGSVDGSVYLYGTSITQSFSCARLIRACPPLIMSSAVHTIHLTENEYSEYDQAGKSTRVLIVSADLKFHVLELSPQRRCLYNGSIAPAFYNMSSNANKASKRSLTTKLLQVQLTKSGVLCVLCNGDNTGHAAFLYDKLCQLWQRVGDSYRFVMSDFFTILPSPNATLSNAKDYNTLQLHAIESLCNPCAAKYTNILSQSHQYEVSRSHCEDRMSVAILLGDKLAFENWLRCYTCRICQTNGKETGNDVRFLVDLIIGKENDNQVCDRLWWWHSSRDIDFATKGSRKDLLQKIVIPELAKHRHMQRLVREVTIEIDSMMNDE